MKSKTWYLVQTIMFTLTNTSKVVAEKLQIKPEKVKKVFKEIFKIAYDEYAKSEERFQFKLTYLGKIYLHESKKSKNGERKQN